MGVIRAVDEIIFWSDEIGKRDEKTNLEKGGGV